jgi:hypothetical protein
MIFIAYAGRSMNPTLREPEMMEIVPYGNRPVRVGDVVFFASPEADRPVVHRIVLVTPAGIRTRGDNNSERDKFVLQPKDIEGRVVAAWRGQKRREIAGGWRGWLTGHWCGWQRIIDRKVSSLLRPFYHLLSHQTMFVRLLPAQFAPRVVVFQSSGQEQFRLLIGDRVIGRYDTRSRQWQIKRPFRLFVDKRLLSTLEDKDRAGIE